MKIGTKCSFNKEQLLCSINKGLKYLEFHTNYEDFNGSIDFKEIKDILDKHNVKCHAIHAPIADALGRQETISIGTFHKEQRIENIELFKKCIQLANFLCDIENPIVVSHIGTGYSLNNKENNTLSKKDIDTTLLEASEDLTTLNDYIVNNYPNTYLVVENMPSMTYSKKDEIISWYFGTREDLPNFIEKLNLSNIKTCLDICHLTTTMRIDKIKNPFHNKSLSYYMSKYSKTLGLFHLNNCVKLGEYTNIHSQPFKIDSPDDINMLCEFITALEENNITCPITLEINDTDYFKQKNVEATIESIDVALKKLANCKLKFNKR